MVPFFLQYDTFLLYSQNTTIKHITIKPELSVFFFVTIKQGSGRHYKLMTYLNIYMFCLFYLYFLTRPFDLTVLQLETKIYKYIKIIIKITI